ncbi:MAG: FAD-dependent oxidoreductase [Chloroflexota bacterium]
MYELMIIGAGPAGLAAAVYAARKRLNALLLSTDIGGQLNNNWGVENYLGFQFITGPDLIDKFRAQVDQFPIEQKIGSRVVRLSHVNGGFEAVSESEERYQAKSVLLATGKRPKRLNVPGEAEFSGKGVAYCTICDGPIFAGQRVAVIGGGNSALEATLDMVKIAEHVDLIAPYSLAGDEVLVEKVKEAKNVTVRDCCKVERIDGDGLVKSLSMRDTNTDRVTELPVSGIFVEIGLEPSSEIVSGLLQVNEKGEVPVNCSSETAVPGLFAAGDVTDAPEKQILVAAGEGAKALLRAHRYLKRLKE